MNRLHALTFLGVVGAASAAFALPRVEPEVIPVSQTPILKTVTLAYRLDGDPGIVTADVQTNRGDGTWISAGAAHRAAFAGDVNRALAGGGAEHSITWNPYETWPRAGRTEMRFVLRAWATNAPPPFLAVDLDGSQTRRYYACAEDVPGGLTDVAYKTTKLLLRRIPAAGAEFRMGASCPTECNDTSYYAGREMPHRVSFSADFYVGVYPVTQKQYALFYDNCLEKYGELHSSLGGHYPSAYAGADRDVHPVENVAYTFLYGSTQWPASQGVIAAGDLPRIMGRARYLTGLAMDLPTEAQWEFACRAGTDTVYGQGANAWSDALGWTSSNADYDGSTRAVGQGTPNAWNLYDLHGNVWELCRDWFDENYYASSPEIDPPGPTAAGTQRVTRGGRFNGPPVSARAATRAYSTYNQKSSADGFRLSCPAVVPGF